MSVTISSTRSVSPRASAIARDSVDDPRDDLLARGHVGVADVDVQRRDARDHVDRARQRARPRRPSRRSSRTTTRAPRARPPRPPRPRRPARRAAAPIGVAPACVAAPSKTSRKSCGAAIASTTPIGSPCVSSTIACSMCSSTSAWTVAGSIDRVGQPVGVEARLAQRGRHRHAVAVDEPVQVRARQVARRAARARRSRCRSAAPRRPRRRPPASGAASKPRARSACTASIAPSTPRTPS